MSKDSSQGRGPLGTPTPGQMALSQPDFQQPNDSADRRRSSGDSSGSQVGDLGEPTPAQSMLRSLQEQQDAMDTIRAGNHMHQHNDEDSSSNNELQGLNYTGNLSDLFKAPFSPPKEEEETEIEFQEQGPYNGAYNFREALLAEQRQQQAILQERQRSFEQHYLDRDSNNPGSPPQPSPTLTPKPSPKSAMKSPAKQENQPSGHPSNLPKLQNATTGSSTMRPARLTNGNRGVSAPAGNVVGEPIHKHNRTVSWSLEQLETFHSDDPVEKPNSNEVSSRQHSHNRGLEDSSRKNGSSRASFLQGRPRVYSEDAQVTLGKEKINLQDIIGMAPFESEAETNILRALDEFTLRNQMTKPEETEDDAAFFASLPSDFSLADDLLESDNEEEKAPNDSVSKNEENKNRKTINTSNHEKKTSDFSAGNLSAHSTHQQPPTRPRLTSQMSSRQLQQSPPQSQRRFSTVRPRAHRYTQSVEQTLFGLTAQLSKIDGLSLTSSHDDDDDDDDSFAADADENRNSAKTAYRHHRVFSSADKVAEATHSLVKKAHKRDASQYSGGGLRRPSLLRGRTDNDTLPKRDASHHSKPSKGVSLPAVLHPRAYTPTGDIEAQENAQLPAVEQMESNFSKWRLGRDSYSSHDDKSVGRHSIHSLGGASQAKHHHAPTVIDEGDEDEGEGMPTESEKEKDKAAKARKRRRRRRDPKRILAEGFKEDWELFSQFLNPRKRSIWLYCKAIFCFVVLPATGIAALLFYVFENPTTIEEEQLPVQVTEASVSWWILFLCVRQVVTLSLAMATQSFVIDYIALGSRFSLELVGPVMTLLLVQSKGWPFIVTVWALFDLGMLSGSNKFVQHWGYWQEWIDLFNERNPSGDVIENDTYLQILRLAMILGAVVAVKRLVVGLFLGRQTFVHYSEELTKVMKRMVIVSEVAALSRDPLPRSDSEYLPDTDQFKSKNLTALMSEEEGSTLSMRSVKDSPDVDAANTLPKVHDTKASTGGQNTNASKEQIPTVEDTQTTNPNNNTAGSTSSNNAANKGPTSPPSPTTKPATAPTDVPTSVGGIGGVFIPPERQTIMDLLERWEEPERPDNGMDKKATLGAVLQFRRALAFTKKRYPFSPAFGPADTREICIESAQDVYDRLLLRRPGQYEELTFETLAVLATNSKGSVDEDTLKDLIKVFRPDRDGKLTRLAFVKSIDAVYKRLRMLSANIHNSSQIDVAVENLVNVGFYTIVGCIALARLGIDPLQLFFSLSSVILAFAFMFGSGAAKYFEGVLLILLQRPFGVGDRIHVSNCQNDVSMDGQAGWIVEKVNLYNTTVCFGTTNERATISNGSLATSRIINAARSPNAIVYVQLKFGLDVPYEKILIFRRAAEQHVAARPREWLAFLGFRAGAISVDLGFITYTIVVQHREPWQHVVSILESKATLTTYCLEVAKQLDMRYRSPPLPVDLNVFQSGGQQVSEELLKKYAAQY